MIIRKAEPRDAVKLYKLEQELFDIENYPLSKSSFAYHLRNNLLYIAEVEGNIAGYVLVLIKRANAKLYSIGVSEDYRGRKIAVKLMAIISKELVSLGFKVILLEVRVDNEIAIALYKRLGFNVKKRLEAFYRDGCDAYLMELEYGTEKLQGAL
ncbi:acetyltransferase, GNAT family [Sulfurimonas gotlandica GD1]|jgi:ribosomal-protein-alanine N-acetyltransferase|uniref:[Ribosomal protein bS18]-alanine N-acetyltransferase n=1 Tax=Sulfurimonas gotlandica (strain DSM 19862 / JCM 16533 / GD1) TaxID=929558 RepID=B6BIL7_SULGG|nr:ribosomal protein S18-alanine N-acetyltransferase [Sulfurimonas gotlandica]EDZ63390.1 ribosomal-protein-alanine acetyltransferase [Sulfurimonas gotlandica GD1]EHP30372.1 acetyltransferase, GNAT family [Sulfurimonas gotlandica GD1]